MKAEDIVAEEVARQAKFGMEPSLEDFAIAGVLAGIKEVVDLLMATVDYECEDENGSPTISFWFVPEEWQAKLKEWGISE